MNSKKVLSAVLAAVMAVALLPMAVFAQGTEKHIANADELADAIANQQANETWYLAEGEYNLSTVQLAKYASWQAGGQGNWYFPIYEDGITIIGEGDVTVTSDVPTDNAGLAWDDNGVLVTVDKTALKNAVEEMQKVDAKDYTEESFAAFKKALDNAVAVLNDTTALQDDVDKAVEELAAAYKALVKVENNGEDVNAPNTGDTGIALAVAATIVSGMALAAVTLRKKEQ